LSDFSTRLLPEFPILLLRLIWVEPYFCNGLPVAHSTTTPAFRHGLFGRFIDASTLHQQLTIEPGVALCGGDKANASDRPGWNWMAFMDMSRSLGCLCIGNLLDGGTALATSSEVV
jgi:hypothetical protein